MRQSGAAREREGENKEKEKEKLRTAKLAKREGV